MTEIDVQQDPQALTLTVTTHLDAGVERVWQIWADPRQLERWWGPPSYPTTIVDHDLTAGGRVSYFMTGPEGDKHHGWWRVLSVDEPTGLEIEDGFADDSGTPNPDMPTTQMRVRLEPAGEGRTTMRIVTQFSSLADMERLVAMGMVEGIKEAASQIPALLAS
jgi:uncharacterized protein YndB with AHSA1/START domain